jgi:hypothetical protein
MSKSPIQEPNCLKIAEASVVAKLSENSWKINLHPLGNRQTKLIHQRLAFINVSTQINCVFSDNVSTKNVYCIQVFGTKKKINISYDKCISQVSDTSTCQFEPIVKYFFLSNKASDTSNIRSLHLCIVDDFLANSSNSAPIFSFFCNSNASLYL